MQSAPRHDFTDAEAYLVANDGAYKWLLHSIHQEAGKTGVENTLMRLRSAANFAAALHTGRFADGLIENLVLEIGQALGPVEVPSASGSQLSAPKRTLRRVLHYTEHVASIGGHTRMLVHWAKADTSSCHSLVLVSQGGTPVPDSVREAIEASGGTIAHLPESATMAARALWLRDFAKRNADLVVLHHFPSDILPTLAFAVPDGPPVAVLNHADHLFWPSSAVTDLVINLRSAAIPYSCERRFIAGNAVLPVPLEDRPVFSKAQARRELGMAAGEIVLLSVGRAEKYKPCGSCDFAATAARILDANPQARLYVVGATAHSAARNATATLHERLHFVGEMDDPSLFRSAADIYLESFPFGSQTALLEAALTGLPVIPAPNPLHPLLVANDDTLAALLSNPRDEQEYVDRATALINDDRRRSAEGERLRARLLASHVGQGWIDRLEALYQQSDPLVHSPHPIPVGTKQCDPSDLGLCFWHLMSGRASIPSGSRAPLDPFLAQSVFARLRAGDYRTARRLTLENLLRRPHQSSSWHLLAFTARRHAGALLRVAGQKLRPSGSHQADGGTAAGSDVVRQFLTDLKRRLTSGLMSSKPNG